MCSSLYPVAHNSLTNYSYIYSHTSMGSTFSSSTIVDPKRQAPKTIDVKMDTKLSTSITKTDIKTDTKTDIKSDIKEQARDDIKINKTISLNELDKKDVKNDILNKVVNTIVSIDNLEHIMALQEYSKTLNMNYNKIEYIKFLLMLSRGVKLSSADKKFIIDSAVENDELNNEYECKYCKKIISNIDDEKEIDEDIFWALMICGEVALDWYMLDHCFSKEKRCIMLTCFYTTFSNVILLETFETLQGMGYL